MTDSTNQEKKQKSPLVNETDFLDIVTDFDMLLSIHKPRYSEHKNMKMTEYDLVIQRINGINTPYSGTPIVVLPHHDFK